MQIAHGIASNMRFLLLASGLEHFNYSKNLVVRMYSLQQPMYKKPMQSSKKRTGKLLKSNKNVKEQTPVVYMRSTIGSITNILRFSTWESAQDQLEKLSIRWDSYTVNQVLKTHPPMEKAWLFFNWASRLKGFKHDQFTYTTMLDIFGEAGRLLSMKYVFQQMQDKGIKIDTVTYTSLLHWLSKHGDANESLNIWKEMRDKGCRPTVVSYTACMKVLFDNNRPKEAAALYKEMLEAGCSPNCYTYTVIIDYLAGAGKFNEALEILSKMQESGIQPDKAACNVFVHKCSIAGETSVLSQILLYMKENSLVLHRPVYLEALEALRTAGENTYLLQKVNPHFSYQALTETPIIEATLSDTQFHTDKIMILYLLTRKNFVGVEQLLGGMIEKKIQLNSKLIGTIIEANCASSRSTGALLAFQYSIELGLKLERSAYLSLIGLLTRNGLYGKVVDIIEEMVRAGFTLGTHLASVLIYRLGCVGMLDSAVKVFDSLPDENTTTYTALMGAYIKCGNIDQGLEIYKIMRRKGIPMASSTFEVLQMGLQEAGRTHEAEFYWKEQKNFLRNAHLRKDISPEESLCDILFGGAFKVSNCEEF